MDDVLRQRLRQQAVQVAAMRDVIFRAVALLEIDERQAIVDDLKGANYVVRKITRKDKRRTAAPPFTTSTLQQEAGRKLGFSAKRTMIVAQQLYEGVDVGGADVMITRNVPRGAGLSSSASFEVAFGLALAALAGRGDYDRSALALAGQRAEHLFAGCKCGIMDQLVSAHGVAGHATLIDCRTLGVTPVAMPDDVAVLIVHSGIERGLVDGEYNLRRSQCEAAVAHYGVAALRDLDEGQLFAARGDLDETAFARARHVVSENRRTIDAAAALAGNDLRSLGQLMAQSHASMRDDFAITTPAIDRLAALLHTAIGGEGGARMTGGGFGGAVVAVMRGGAVDTVVDAVMREYRTPAGEVPLIMRESPSAGATVLA